MIEVRENAVNQVAVRNRVWCMILLVLFGWMASTVPTTIAFAQDEEKAAATDDGAKGGAEGKAEPKKPQESFLAWMIRASGIFGFLIMLVSFAMVAIIMMIALQLRRDNYIPAAFVEEFEQQLQAKDYQAAYETAKGSDSFIGRILAAGMCRLSRGYDEAVEQMQ